MLLTCAHKIYVNLAYVLLPHVKPVRRTVEMEEHVTVEVVTLIVPAPVGTLGPTVSTEVCVCVCVDACVHACMCAHTCVCIHMHAACKNGGTCSRLSLTGYYCDCPSAYYGSYCQHTGTYAL